MIDIAGNEIRKGMQVVTTEMGATGKLVICEVVKVGQKQIRLVTIQDKIIQYFFERSPNEVAVIRDEFGTKV